MAEELEQTDMSVDTRSPKRATSPVSRSVVRPIRTFAVLAAVGALVTAIALPALATGAASPATASPATAQQIAAGHAQSIVVASEATAVSGTRSSFTATTPQEIEQKKAEEAAVAAAKAAAEAAAKPSVASVRTNMAPIASPGQVIYPMAAGSYTLSDGFGAARSGRSHMGQDFAAPIGTPIYAAADGCVTISQDGYGGYGETIELSHPALSGANAISTLYGHMNYGSRAVSVGQCVTAGQYLGEVGNTGWVSGSCLHFEVLVNNTEIDPLAWLEVNVR
ncbi:MULTISPECIES: M23 family metallopeptidase [unclassified Microbacterium]|uniref:M23 family metallopeptidase n=1 Tax=unclassified Microbacterium TaxID=2609290 RepID=UPI001E42CF19|nr:M23 family metallopeptidase [Microbacterium sp. Au-Mic1]MCE4026594.1 M23 family metallopeptidase [Microbacterium sp. Au-Mic1]